jgi:polyhydroxyalkanoate synthase
VADPTRTTPSSPSRGARRAGHESALVNAALNAAAGASFADALDVSQAFDTAGLLTRTVIEQGPLTFSAYESLSREWGRVALGRSEVQPAANDRRFVDAAWTENPLYRRLGQAYLAWSRTVYGLIDRLDFDERDRLRAWFLAGLVTEAVAPTNSLLGNPAALRRAVRTRGRSLLDGARHWLHDVVHHGGMPSTVDTRPFTLGETVATTPGAVVYRDEVLELLHYRPTTAQVHVRPLVVVPPQINKYYVLDLAPGRSLVEAALQESQQVFMVSWRNPGRDQGNWTLATYVTALLAATDAARTIAGQADLNVLGVCAGGITTAALLGYLAAVGDERVNAVTLLVTALDWGVPSTVGTFTSGPSVAAALRRSRRNGVLEGRELSTMFAWLRPDDLVWNYWVNNYLLGHNPPAFDILAWNADATNLPAGLHADFLALAADSSLARPGGLEVLGEKIDLRSVICDAYIVGGLTDHIIPWQGCYRSLEALGGATEFVLSASGHVQTLVSPRGAPKARYFVGGHRPTDPEEWRTEAEERAGSWWDHWLLWLGARAGALVDAPEELGSADYPAGDPAPGTYVRG